MKRSEQLLSFSDLVEILRRSKNKIKFCAVIFCLLAIIFALTRPVDYQAIASFREKGKSQSGIAQNSITSLLMSSSSSNTNGETISTLKSGTILEELAKQNALQADLKIRKVEWNLFARIYKNLIIEWAQIFDKKEPLFADDTSPIYVKAVNYPLEHRTTLRLIFDTENSFYLAQDSSKIGKLGVPFTYDGYSFTIERQLPEQITGEEYRITLLPMYELVKDLHRRLTVESDRDDKYLVRLKFKYPNRYQAAEILNSLMEIYQVYLQEDQYRIMNKQIEYLYTRHDEVADRLKVLMASHAENLSSDVASTGFPDTTSALAFFANTQQQYSRELLKLELELRRLNLMQTESSYGKLDAAPSVIHEILDQIHQLKKQSDTLELVLHKSGSEHHVELKNQWELLSEVEEFEQEIGEILASLNNNEALPQNLKLLQDNHFNVNIWYEKIASCDDCRDHFRAYLQHLAHLFHVQSQAIKDQLIHHQPNAVEFQGIDLETAKGLYLNYSRDLNEIEAKIKQIQFIQKQIQEPSFEISALSTVVDDSVSQKMIAAASELSLSMHDHKNRSTKELERIKEELALQKQFLAIHLNQIIELQQLKKELYKEKIETLQRTTLALIHQEITLLQAHLSNHIDSKIASLNQEKGIIEKHQKELQQEMALLPNKWVNEKMIDHQLELEKKMVEEVAKLVETKNISRNLELIQSAPLDSAKPPIQPVAQNLLLYAFLGAAFGTIFASTISFGRSMIIGIPITARNLQLAGFHVSGTLNHAIDTSKPILDGNLSTLRKVAGFITNRLEPPKCLLLLMGHESDYAAELAKLMGKKGYKTLLISGSFNLDTAKIIEREGYHTIATDGISRYSHEAILSPRFQAFLQDKKGDYDWIFVAVQQEIGSAEAEAMLPLFAATVVSIKDQTWPALEGYHIDNLTFIITK